MIPMLMNVALGIWLILAPAFLLYEDSRAANFDRAIGPLIAAIATVCLWEVMSPVRWLCALAGLILLFSPIWLGHESESALVVHLIVGLMVTAMSLIVRKAKHRYNGGWRALIKKPRADLGRITWS